MKTICIRCKAVLRDDGEDDGEIIKVICFPCAVVMGDNVQETYK